MNIERKGYPSIEQLTDQLRHGSKSNVNSQTYKGASFNEILADKKSVVEPVHFSRHASDRLSERDITLSNEQLHRLTEGTTKAATKGINESLVLLDNLAFIVNTKNNTVITAMDSSETNDKIFTNIDGAVII